MSNITRSARHGARLGTLLLVLLLLAAPAQAERFSAYAWDDADLALIYPAGWDEPVAATAQADNFSLMLDGGDMAMNLVVLPVSVTDADLRAALDAQIAALNLLPLRYAVDPLFGRIGLSADSVSADRTLIGYARSGRLPDDRGFVIAARAPAASSAALTDTLNAVLGSIVFSADLPPVQPVYHPIWSAPSADQPVIDLAIYGSRLYVLDVDGIRQLDAATGETLADYPFEHPAQPTAIAVDQTGTVYVADTVCRCILNLLDTGRWVDPLGSFGGGAPFSLAVAPDGTIYAADKSDAGYELRSLGEPRNRTIGLNFNADAPPLVAADSSGQVWVIEWLSSLIDGSTSGAVSLVSGDKPTADLRFWLETLSPDVVTAMTTTPEGDLAFATTDQGVLLVDSDGSIVDRIAPDDGLRALAFGEDGVLYAARADGGVAALTTSGLPDRFGGRALALGVPVLGTLTAAEPVQSWTYEGTAGDHMTISAVDQTRTNVYQLGLDMSLRLLAPDGVEVAFNDDQLSDDLFGVYDSEIADVVLPQTGTYTIRVEWQQGQGTYTLGVSGPRPVDLSADGVTRLSGRLQNVFPVERWTFAGEAGDVLTMTMSALTGTVDPSLVLRQPDGSLLAFNADAADPELKTAAQLTQVTLPVDGTYTVEAWRYVGAGTYSLVIVNTG